MTVFKGKLRRKRWVNIFLLIFLPPLLYGQQSSLPDIKPELRSKSMPASIGLSVGSKGIPGLDIALGFSERLSVKFGLNIFNLAISGYDHYFSQYDRHVIIDATFRQTNLEILAEFAPFRGKLKAVAGFGYFFLNRFSGTVRLRDNVPLNDIDVTPEEIGSGTGYISFKSPVSPYLGLAIGDFIPRKKLGFSVDIGTFYKGRPQLEIEATRIVRHNDVNEEVIENGISSYRWWPVLSFRIAYKII